MELKILGSSSAGNCYILDNGKEALVIECGISFHNIKEALSFDISRIVGALVSHEHGDHAKETQKLLDARINVYMSAGTLSAIRLKGYFMPLLLEHANILHVGGFRVLPFNIKHDAAEPLGFLIDHEETGAVLFATDCVDLPYSFDNLSNIIIECNHSVKIVEEKLRNGTITEAQSVRTLRNHLSYESCKDILLANDLSTVHNIVLAHLSDSNSDASQFQQGIQEATAKMVYVADKGMTINFNKTPF